LRQFRLVIAIALVWAIAFSSVVHAKPKRLKPPRIKTTLVRATPIAGYAQSGLEVAISRGWVSQYSPYADRLRMAISELRSGDVDQASRRSGIKPQVINRLINVGMVPTAPTAATPESQKKVEVPDDEDF
jgi:hypothetical protein